MLKILKSKIRYRGDPEYIHCKEELDKLYQRKINGAIILSRCDCYEHEEISSKFSLNLEKNRAFKVKLEPSQAVRKK